MQLDAGHLSAFYDQAVGHAAQRLISRRIMGFWPQAKGLRLLGYGFATPYLDGFRAESERVIAAMPARTGAIVWPAERPLSVLVEEESLPFADALFDRILVVHGLEAADAARGLLRQLWRVLAPEGRILLVVPNRASLWAQIEASPFACGRPFHKSELTGLLSEALFEPLGWDRALYLPPFAGRRLAGFGDGFEKLGRRLCPGVAGVLLVEAVKSLYGRTARKAPAKAKAVLRPAATLQS